MIMMTPFTSSTNAPTPATKGKKPYKSWLKDGVNGGPSSMEVLVNWLSKKANYAKWKGDDCERIPKKSLLESIIDEMREVGIYHRLAKDVASKISTLQSNYRLVREWKEVEGKKLLENGVSEEGIHEELVKRFPYWDSLDEVFNSTRTSSWPMSISSIMHSNEEDDLFHVKQEEYAFEDEEDSIGSPPKRRRRLSDSTLQPTTQRSSIDNTSDSASTTHSTQSLPTSMSVTSPIVIKPLPRVLPSPISNSTAAPPPPTIPPPSLSTNHKNFSTIPSPSPPPSSYYHYLPHPYTTEPHRRDHVLAESLLQMTREKEAGRMKRSQDMLQFLREKRMEREQLLIEKELTKRVKAKAELVKNLMEAGFDKNAIAEQLNML
ncbi:uncharacterized protein B0P05DRAFT_534035 [Gilbertella persicaria]|uniref:Uncharacterized protein n=1 Tax=Rhizopus stolonifer TaxID=4846 RepID=A0A367J2N5_RHIST|nr:uncharacterized protein B0P05DRAFT_534035 [Gilbertella persicaria]KAI8085869.1 hypothetical protein B0P05DRAFT_534035 [Gilbertella persicaria]RCH84186.1 hypothetical protein CU098_006709 [Rhizopus stolonifer]